MEEKESKTERDKNSKGLMRLAGMSKNILYAMFRILAQKLSANGCFTQVVNQMKSLLLFIYFCLGLHRLFKKTSLKCFNS